MSNVSTETRIEIDKKKLEGRKKRLDKLMFEVTQTESEIRIIEARIAYNEVLLSERKANGKAKKTENEESNLFQEAVESTKEA